VLNGIAHNPATGDIYLTGKYWPKMYKVKLVEK
jgi:glutaminyl-peptide cyclotransferase